LSASLLSTYCKFFYTEQPSSLKKELPISNKVRDYRKNKSAMAKSELGTLVGVTRQAVAAIEQGNIHLF
jgi:hypothetical protein